MIMMPIQVLKKKGNLIQCTGMIIPSTIFVATFCQQCCCRDVHTALKLDLTCLISTCTSLIQDTMRLLIEVTVVFLKLICILNCTTLQHMDHDCPSQYSEEPAGMASGTIRFKGDKCTLKLINIKERANETNRLNIVGVGARRNDDCDKPSFYIDGDKYCIYENATDTLINVTDMQARIEVVADQNQSFSISYYKGKFLM